MVGVGVFIATAVAAFLSLSSLFRPDFFDKRSRGLMAHTRAGPANLIVDGTKKKKHVVSHHADLN